MRWPLRTLLLVLILSAGWECWLRWRGYHRLPLFVADPRYEYMTAPGQRIATGDIRFITNEVGMRCGPIGTKKRKRVLVVGDSVINGGLSSTQDSLATSIAERVTGVQVLNCSAPSWGPDNAAAFLGAHGLFDADRLIAVFSSHDAFDRMTFGPIVGHHPAYPDHAPVLALESYVRKLTYRPGPIPVVRDAESFNPGWQALRAHARAAGIPFTVLLHPERAEATRKRYDARGERLLDSLRSWNVDVVEMRMEMDSTLYWDGIHVNDHGQRAIGDMLARVITAN